MKVHAEKMRRKKIGAKETLSADYNFAFEKNVFAYFSVNNWWNRFKIAVPVYTVTVKRTVQFHAEKMRRKKLATNKPFSDLKLCF